jgi:hypothetical protein
MIMTETLKNENDVVRNYINDLGITNIVKDIKNKEKISISHIQRTYSFGFVKANRIFGYLAGFGLVTTDGVVNKKRIYEVLGETPTKCMNIIFLDVDGVLNCRSTKDRCGPYIGIDDKKVALLKELVDSTDSIIVLVSSWKEWWTNNPKFKQAQDELANYLDAKLEKQGLTIADKTDDYNSYNRGDGILNYLDLQKKKGIEINKFIILDDEMFDYEETKLTRNLIQTSFEKNGLEKKHIRKAMEKLC